MKIGFIGFGNMAQALAEGFLLKQGGSAGGHICLRQKLGKTGGQREKVRDLPLPGRGGNGRALRLVVVAVKPYQ